MPAATMRRSFPIFLMAVIATLGLSHGSAGLVSAALPAISVMLAATPNPADGKVTYTGTVYVLSGTPTNIEFGMGPAQGQFQSGICEPAPFCRLEMGRPIWTFPTMTGTQIVTYETAPVTGTNITFGTVSEGVGCYVNCPATLYSPYATVTSELTWWTSGQVVTGSTLHMTARAWTDSWWMDFANLHVGLPAGVDPPTNLPSDALYSPGPHYIDRPASYEPSSEYSFDVVVNAAPGSTLTFTASGGSENGILVRNASLSIKVGQGITRRPRPAARSARWWQDAHCPVARSR